MSPSDEPDRRREVVDVRAREMFSAGGYPVTASWSAERFRDLMEFARRRFTEDGKIQVRIEFVDDMMRAQARRTKLRTRLIIWSLGLVTAVIGAMAGGLFGNLGQWLSHK